MGWSYCDRFVPDYLPIDENHPLRPENVYGLSKEIGETIAQSYARKGLETVMLRPSGVVTPEELGQIKKDGGRRPTGFRVQLHRCSRFGQRLSAGSGAGDSQRYYPVRRRRR